MQRLHSSGEDLYNMPQEDLAEAFGTPPTRNNSIKPLRKLSGEYFYALPTRTQNKFVLIAGCIRVDVCRQEDQEGGEGRHASSEEQAGEAAYQHTQAACQLIQLLIQFTNRARPFRN